MLTANVIGNIGGEPELRYTPNGQPVLNFNVAHNFNEKVGDEWEQRVEWIRCVVFGERGETLMQHLKKGQRVYVQGQLKARPWTDREDNIRAGLEVIARDVEFAGERQETDRSTYNPAPSGQPSKPKTATAANSATKRPPADNSDLPF